MRRTLFHCDDVFEHLTAGPFPQGGPDDDRIREHLRDCPACQDLAEALRPACNLLRESLSSAERSTLPMFLDGDDPEQRIMRCIVQASPGSPYPTGKTRKSPRLMFWVAVAASVMLMAGSALVAWSGSNNEGTNSPMNVGTRLLALNLPSECGWLCSADGTPHPSGIGQAMCSECHAKQTTNPDALGLQCCTSCHGAGRTQIPVRHMATLLAACQDCHR